MFCKLEQNESTFLFFKEYFKSLMKATSTDKVQNLDLQLQLQEIKNHLNVNNKNQKDNKECIKWIEENSKNYRLYLNTLKIVKLIFDCICEIENKTIDQIIYEDFKKVEAIINNEKESILENIFS